MFSLASFACSRLSIGASSQLALCRRLVFASDCLSLLGLSIVGLLASLASSLSLGGRQLDERKH